MFVKSASEARTPEQSVVREHLRIRPCLLQRWLLAQLFAQVAFEEGQGGLCYVCHHLTYERDACWGEEL